MEDHGRQPNDSLMYASGGPLPSPALMPTLERRVLELEKRDVAQQELIEALARGFMGLIEVCQKQQVEIEGLNQHLEMHGNALASHGKVLARVEADYEDDGGDDEWFEHLATIIALYPDTAAINAALPRRPR